MSRKRAAGALLDVYEQAISDLKKTIAAIPDSTLPFIVDTQTIDENCRSIQTILTHVVHSGYGYATSIQNVRGNNIKRPDKIFHLTTAEYLQDLDKVFRFTEEVLNDIPDIELEQLVDSLKIKAGWGQLYDIEQLMEHAIVHILRHRRQIENIIQ